MLAFFSLASLIALSQAGVLPAGVDAATCANYPFCGPNPADYGPGAAPILAAQEAVKQQLYLAALPALPVVPGKEDINNITNILTEDIAGLDVHAAAENAQLARMGVPAGLTAHMAAEAKIKSQQAELANINNSLGY